MNIGVVEVTENGIVITEELNQQLSEIANDEGISVQELINDFIKEGLKNDGF